MSSEKSEYVKTKKKGSVRRAPSSLYSPSVLKFMQIEDNLNDEQISFNCLDLILSNGDLDSEIDKISSGYAICSILAAYASERADVTRTKRRQLFGVLENKARGGEIQGKLTDIRVRAFIESHDSYVTVSKRLAREERQALILEQVTNALDIKSRMLQTKSANIRAMMHNSGDVMRPNDSSFSNSGKKSLSKDLNNKRRVVEDKPRNLKKILKKKKEAQNEYSDNVEIENELAYDKTRD